jgi:hypothetical protein
MKPFGTKIKGMKRRKAEGSMRRRIGKIGNRKKVYKYFDVS